MAAPVFNIVFKDAEGNFHNCGAVFTKTFDNGKMVYNVKLQTETGEGQYGATMRLDEAAEKALNKEGFINFYPVKPKSDDGY